MALFAKEHYRHEPLLPLARAQLEWYRHDGSILPIQGIMSGKEKIAAKGKGSRSNGRSTCQRTTMTMCSLSAAKAFDDMLSFQHTPPELLLAVILLCVTLSTS